MMRTLVITLAALSVSMPLLANVTDIDEKAYRLCDKQQDFLFFSAVASTGRNIKMSPKEPGVPEFRALGRDILLSDKEIDHVVDLYAKDNSERYKVIGSYSGEAKRTAAIFCSQIPAQRLITYERLKNAGYLN